LKIERGVGLCQLHDGRLVTAAIAVIGGGEDGDDVLVLTKAVSLHHELMGTGDHGQIVALIEFRGDVFAEGVSGTTGRDAPTRLLSGVRPEQIAHRSFMGDLVEKEEIGMRTEINAK
jgi:hypothetical protein